MYESYLYQFLLEVLFDCVSTNPLIFFKMTHKEGSKESKRNLQQQNQMQHIAADYNELMQTVDSLPKPKNKYYCDL